MEVGLGQAVGKGYRGDVSDAKSCLTHLCTCVKTCACTHTHTHTCLFSTEEELGHETLVLPSDTSDTPVSDELHGSYMGFPDSSVGKESTCNAGDPSSIPRSGRSCGEGIGYPLQYSWAFLVAQLVKNPPAMQETWV